MDLAKLARDQAVNRVARRALATQTFADAVDLVALVRARGVPLPTRAFGGALAAGSAAVGAAYARRPA